MTIPITFFNGARDNVPKPAEVEWPLFDGHIQTTDKVNTLAFSPATFIEGECPECDERGNRKCKYCNGTMRRVRAKLNVESISLAVIDLDHLTMEDFSKTLDLFDGCQMLLYSSWSHLTGDPKKGIEPIDDWCGRLVMTLTRPLLNEEWAPFWRALAAKSEYALDGKVKDSSRLYFVPSHHVDSEVEPIFEVFEGDPLDVDKMLRTAPPPRMPGRKKRATNKGQTTSADLETLANRLIKSTSSTTKAASKAIKLALKGECYSSDGERDNTLLYVAGELAKEFTDEDPDHLAGFFADSIDAVERRDGDGGPDLDNFTNKIERKQTQIEEERAELEAIIAEKQKEKRARTFQTIGVERDEEYSYDELEEWGVKSNEWIIQKGDLYYFRVLDRYSRGYTHNEALVQAEMLLSPAKHIRTEKLNKQGDLVPVSLRDLVSEHGQVVDKIAFDVTASKSYLDDGALFEAPCGIEIEPEFSSEVQQWLELLGGDNVDALLEWVGYVPSLKYPLTALYLSGPPHSGKSLLANGLSQLWDTGGPTRMETVLASFNSSITRCPLVFGDEKLPEKMSTEHLRSLIQDRSTQINAKYKEEVPMRGSLRYILAANNKKLLRPSDDMTLHDVEAFAERFFYIDISEKVVDFLEQIGHERIHKEWIEGQAIAKHCLWLNSILEDPGERTSRFLVTGGESGLVDYLMVHSGARSAICQWLVAFLKEPKHLRQAGKIRVEDGELLLDVETLYANWDAYHRRERLPSITKLSSLLEGITTSYLDDDGEHVHRVNIDLLALWADTTGVATPQRVRALIKEAEEYGSSKRKARRVNA